MRTRLYQEFYTYNILDYTLFLSIITLFLDNSLNSIALICFCLAGAFVNSWKDKKRRLEKNYIWLLPVLLYFVFLASLFWDPNGLDAIKSIEKKTSFLILPVIVSSIPPFKKQTLQVALFVFVISVFIISLACLSKSAVEYLTTNDSRVFFYQYLSRQMHFNAIYLTLYCSFALFILLSYLFKENKLVRLRGWVVILMVVFFCVFILLLSAKTLVAITFLLVIIYIIYLNYQRKQFLKGILITTFIIGSVGLIVAKTHYIRWRVQTTFLKKYEGKEDDQNGLAVRLKLWETAIELITQKPIWGYGIKYANERLLEEYRKDNFSIAAENRYNSHNTYLQVMLNGGVIALIPLSILFFSSIVLAIKRKSYLFLMFISTVALLGSTEAVFEGQKGTVFILLFLFLFICHIEPEKE